MKKIIYVLLAASALLGCDKGGATSTPLSDQTKQPTTTLNAPPLHLPPSSNFKRLRLPRGVSIDIPKSWWVLNDQITNMIHTSAEAAIDITGMELPEGSQVDLIRANSMPRSTYASVAVTSLIPPSAKPDELTALSSEDLATFSGEFADPLNKMLLAQGGGLIGPISVRTDHISNHPTLVMEYHRKGQNGPVLVQSNQIMTEHQEIQITLSYRVSEAPIWQPVMEKIRRSIIIDDRQ